MIYIGSDHAGFELKEKLILSLTKEGLELIDKSINYVENDDYPDMVKSTCEGLKKDDYAIVICGTGMGSCIAANKIKGIRAALCNDIYSAKMTRLDNDANVLCLGGRMEYSKDISNVINIVNMFVNTKFSNDERHVRRINKIKEMEINN